MGEPWRPARTREESLDRAIRSMAPGSWQGKIAQAMPVRRGVPIGQQEPDTEFAEEILSDLLWEDGDGHTLDANDLAAGTVTFPLSFVPIVESLVGFWGVLAQRPSEYSIDFAAPAVTWPLSGFEAVGDRLWVHYAHRGVAAEPLTLFGLPLLFWGSADYEASIGRVDGEVMSGWTNLAAGTWTDSFNNAYPLGDATGTATFRAAGGPGGGPRLTLPSNQVLVFGGVGWGQGASNGGYTSGEMFAVVKAAGNTTRSDWFNIGSSGIDARYPDSDGQIWDEFGGGTYVFTPTMTIDQWRVFSSRQGPSEAATIRLDGVQQYVGASGFDLPGHQPNLGASGGATGFLGSISAFLLFSRVLTAAERAQADAFLAAYPSGGTP